MIRVSMGNRSHDFADGIFGTGLYNMGFPSFSL
jgi:hypothetical protein